DADLLLRLQKAVMVLLKDLARRHALTLRRYSDGRTVRVRAGNHQHAAALQALVAGENVGGQVGPCQMPDMQVAVGVRPRDGYMDRFRHGFSFSSFAPPPPAETTCCCYIST